MSARFVPQEGTWREIPPSGRDPAVLLVVRVYCWCGSIVHLELPRWPEDDCGNCHSVYRLSRGSDNGTPYVRCTRLDPNRHAELLEFLDRTGRNNSSPPDTD